MTEWREFKIKDIADVVGGGTPSTAINEYWNGDIPWLTPKDLTGYIRNFISHGERFITKKGLENSSARLLPKGTVLLTSRAPIGYVAIAENEICTNQGFKSLVPNPDKAHNLFLLYWIKSNVEYLQSIGTGTTFQEISGSVLKDVDIILPPLPEQKAIAEVLSSLDDKIDLLTRQNKTLEDLAQAYFRKWFIEDASDEWEVGKAKDYFEIGIGKTPPRKEEHWFSKNNNDVVWVSISDMGKAGMFIGDSSEYLTKNAVKQFNIKRVPKGAIILSFKLTVGRVAIALRDFTTNEAIAHFIYRNLYEREYLYFYLKTFDYYSLGSTSSIATAVNSKIIKDMPFVMPDVETLKKYHKIAAPMFSKIESNTNQILTLQKIRDTLLPKLISGEIRVKM
ncbi:MAG: restriction endonuclease subunit S [Clostridia bacterium]